MPLAKDLLPQRVIHWTPRLIRDLRGKRSQSEFAARIGVAKNTVWRWEAGYAEPDSGAIERLAAIADEEHFLADWQLVGSITRIGNLEEGSRRIDLLIRKSISRTTRELG